MSRYAPTIALGLDSAERRVIERLCDEGRMPTLAALRDRGRYAVIQSEATYFMSAVWPTFYSSRSSGHHGWYYGKVWRPDRMRLDYGDETFLQPRPFWNHLPPGSRCAIVDVPYVTRPPASFDGFFVSGWQAHDYLGRIAAPGVWGELKRRFGPPALKAERFGGQTAGSLLKIRDETLRALDQAARIGRWLLESRQPDLLMLVFGGLHRASHYLWSLSQIDPAGLDDGTRGTLEAAHDELYEAADHAIGRVLDRAGQDASVLVFALHGMEENDGWALRFRSIVDAMRRTGEPTGASESDSLLLRLRKRVPWPLARQLTRRIPVEANRRLLHLWSGNMYDWSHTPFFALPCDVNGFLRVNLHGREAAGVVRPGREYEALLDHLAEGLLSFRGLETGRPIVSDVTRTDDLPTTAGPARALLPDLIVQWTDESSVRLSGVTSPRFGEVRWTPGPVPSGRSGNHRPDGWVIGAGPSVHPGAGTVCDSIDLVPTLYRWLGADPDPGFHGRPIPELVG